MVKIEMILDESRLTSVEAEVLRVEASDPGSMSKPLLKAVVGAAAIDQEEWLVSRVERLDCTEDELVRDIVLACPVPAGMQLNELGQDCDQCARHDPLRADLCRHIWPHHWQGTLLGIDGRNPPSSGSCAAAMSPRSAEIQVLRGQGLGIATDLARGKWGDYEEV